MMAIPGNPTNGGPLVYHCDDCGELYVPGAHICRANWGSHDWLELAGECVDEALKAIRDREKRIDAIENAMAALSLSLAKDRV